MIKDYWLVGDQFLCEIFSTLQGIKVDATTKKRDPPYIYENYNIYAWYKPIKDCTQCMVRIFNSFVEGLNSRAFCPKYMLIIPDEDILDCKSGLYVEDQLEWLYTSINKAITHRRDDLKWKRPGSMSSSFEPRVIWVEPICRPINNKNAKMINRRHQRFISNLHKIVKAEHYMYALLLKEFEVDTYDNYFNPRSNLSTEGKLKFWHSLDCTMKKFDKHDIDLKP